MQSTKSNDIVIDTLVNQKHTIESELKELDALITQHHTVVSLLNELPDKMHHPVMVPLTSQAFFPGSITHTNDVMMQLGEQLFAKRTMKNCRLALIRRIDFATASKNTLLNSIESLTIKLSALQNRESCEIVSNNKTLESHVDNLNSPVGQIRQTPEGYLEIIEEYHSDDQFNDSSRRPSQSKETIVSQNPSPIACNVVEKALDIESSKPHSTHKIQSIRQSSPCVGLSQYRQRKLLEKKSVNSTI